MSCKMENSQYTYKPELKVNKDSRIMIRNKFTKIARVFHIKHQYTRLSIFFESSLKFQYLAQRICKEIVNQRELEKLNRILLFNEVKVSYTGNLLFYPWKHSQSRTHI